MRLGLYWRYATRSLARNGQRTLLAIFCVAVGVLAIVSLQLVGNMISNALTGNVRDSNGGDVQARSDVTPFTQRQLASFDQLKAQGLITQWTAISAHDGQTVTNGDTQFYTVRAVDPATFPISGSTIFLNPRGGSLSDALSGDGAVATEALLKQLGSHVGDAISVSTNDGRTIGVHIRGEIATTGNFNSPLLLVSLASYQAASSTSGLPVNYSAVYANVPGRTDAAQDAAKKAISQQYPFASVTTVNDAIQRNKDNVQNIRYFLQIVGLLALLIGGVGIINTMQVLLRRRRTEIAMLKTTGYRQRDLYAMFGLEAGLLGLIGGVIGALLGVAASFLLKTLVENLLFTQLPSQIDPVTVALGAVIGFATALIFGIMPIVQASRVRPLAVLRELPEGAGVASVGLSIGLGLLLAVLYFALAYSILQNGVLALFAVGGTEFFLLLLSLFFGLVVFLISKLPVLERFTWWYTLVVVVGILISGLLTLAVPGFGILLLAVSAFGLVVVLLPRTWKQNFRVALRNIGRQKVRTVTTLVALFIGLFVIGVVLALGQNIQDKIGAAIASQVKYNAYVIAGPNTKDQTDAAVKSTSGIQAQELNTLGQGVPVSVNGTPIEQIIANAPRSGANATGKEELLAYLSAVSGYDLAGGSVPDANDIKLEGPKAGQQAPHDLTPNDANTGNALFPARSELAPLHLKVGDTVIIADQDKQHTETLTVSGFYAGISFVGGGIIADNSVAQMVSDGHPFYAYSLKLDPNEATQKLHEIQKQVPGVQTFNVADFLAAFTKILDNFIGMITAIGSLTMLAGVIIIANAVALAMLERRREIGIFKAVGYTSRTVLGEVLIENGIVGFTGGMLALLLVGLVLTVMGKLVFKTDLGVGWQLTLILVLATAFGSMLVAALVAYRSTRVRPLEVLRYE